MFVVIFYSEATVTVKEFNTAWLTCLVKLQNKGIDPDGVEVIIEANDDGILEISRVAIGESCGLENHSGQEFTLVIEGV